jgi:hypothetical protein
MFQIYFHGKNYESLQSHIDGQYLPEKYGGKMDISHFDRMEFYQVLCKYQDVFEGEPHKVIVLRVVLLTYAYCKDEALISLHRPGFNVGELRV